MNRYTKSLLATVLLATPMLGGATVAAMAQMRAPMGMPGGLAAAAFDPAQLPEFKGKVAAIHPLPPRRGRRPDPRRRHRGAGGPQPLLRPHLQREAR